MHSLLSRLAHLGVARHAVSTLVVERGVNTFFFLVLVRNRASQDTRPMVHVTPHSDMHPVVTTPRHIAEDTRSQNKLKRHARLGTHNLCADQGEFVRIF
jgi:hypothetical protein